MITRQNAVLSSATNNTQCLENSAKNGEKSVLTLGSLSLPRYMFYKA